MAAALFTEHAPRGAHWLARRRVGTSSTTSGGASGARLAFSCATCADFSARSSATSKSCRLVAAFAAVSRSTSDGEHELDERTA